MRIKIIGDNDCARATRQLLRQAGFAVTEFLPAEAVTHAPHAGYVITIEISSASAPQPSTPRPSAQNSGPTSVATDSQAKACDYELPPASPPDQTGSSLRPSPAPTPGTALPLREDSAETAARASAEAGSPPPGSTDFSLWAARGSAGAGTAAASSRSAEERTAAWRPPAQNSAPTFVGTDSQAKACATPILIDSVDCPLEAAVLRHITQLSAAPVMLDRPGGVVHSERELRIVVPRASIVGDKPLAVTAGGKTFVSGTQDKPLLDEAAAVAVEFGVLRGLLDLTGTPGRTGVLTSGSAPPAPPAVRKKWWQVFAILLSALLAIAAGVRNPRDQVHAKENSASLKFRLRSPQASGATTTVALRPGPAGMPTSLFRGEDFRPAKEDSTAARIHARRLAFSAARDRESEQLFASLGQRRKILCGILHPGPPAPKASFSLRADVTAEACLASRRAVTHKHSPVAIPILNRAALLAALPYMRRISALAAQGQFGSSQINLALVGGAATASGGANGSLGVGGLAADGSATSGNPVLVAGKGSGNARVPIVCDNWTPINVSNTTAAKLVARN